MSKKFCLGIVLAGGRSSRMGTCKADLKFNDIKLVDWMSSLLSSAGCDRVVISGEDGIPDAYSNRGPLGGLLSVLSEPASVADEVMVTPVDMPLLATSDMMALTQHRDGLKCVSYENSRFPLWFRLTDDVTKMLTQMLTNEPDPRRASLKQFIAGFGEHHQLIPQTDPRRFMNANTPEEWQQLLWQQQQLRSVSPS